MIVYLGLGSNLGDRTEFIRLAIEKIKSSSYFSDILWSELIETSPVGYTQQPDFINCAVKLETELSPEELLNELQSIELELGRKRGFKWGPRTIDIDILFYGDRIIQKPDLLIPHPELHKRIFVLKPLLELCPDLLHPILKKKIHSLYTSLIHSFDV
jgi:2-amino-4-hydroxy-6-hydroxymethyldihydropteridine diphosphokinase